ncbi:cysteine hydrolase [Sphingomonas sp. PAMC26645]|nr:cysteine hydrolase [Sphingomonas sp. PAMC26645]
MAVTLLDPKAALLIVDLQKGLRGLPTVHPMDAVIGNARRLALGFRSKSLPVVIITVAGAAPGRTETPQIAAVRSADWADPVSELEQAADDYRVMKSRWGAFTETGLAEWLRQQGVKQVVIAGVATSMGVESTARHAHELGFHVTLAIDAITDLDAAAHRHSIRIFAKLGETGSTEQILALLDAPVP